MLCCCDYEVFAATKTQREESSLKAINVQNVYKSGNHRASTSHGRGRAARVRRQCAGDDDGPRSWTSWERAGRGVICNESEFASMYKGCGAVRCGKCLHSEEMVDSAEMFSSTCQSGRCSLQRGKKDANLIKLIPTWAPKRMKLI